MTERYDVAVLGGGPAGTGTALALRRHDPSLSVVLVESSDYGSVRIGESLPPPTRKLLEHLGVWGAFSAQGHDTSYGTAAAWGGDEPHDNEFIFHTYREGWHLDRARFDAMLAEGAGAEGAACWTGCAFLDAHRSDGDSWRLELRRNGSSVDLEARFVIDATGRRAAFARRRGVGREVFDDLLGLYVFFRLEDGAQLAAARTLVEAWEEGWWYSARLPDDQLVIACMSDADRIAELGLREAGPWLEAVEASRHTRGLLEGAERLQGPTCHPAQSQVLDRIVGRNWLTVGDASCTYDPLSSQGIFKALRFAIWAAYATSDHLQGKAGALEKYARLVERDFEGYLDSRATYYRQETRWSSSPFWRRRHEWVHIPE